MTVFLVLVFGSLIAIVFAQVNGARKAGAKNADQLRALQARIDALESASGAVSGRAPAAGAAVVTPEHAAVPPPAAAPSPAPAAPPAAPAAGTPAAGAFLPLPNRSGPRAPVGPTTRPAVPDSSADWRREPLPASRLAAVTAPRPAPPPAHAGPPVPGLGERLGAHLRMGWDQWVAQNLLAAAGGVFVLLGASFFVAVAISNGWLTPWRQVAAAVIGGALLLAAGRRAWGAGVSRRAAYILSQSLVGTGAGVMLLGVVAGARIYAHPLYPSWVGLIGAGAISAIVVATSVRWRAQVTAGLGIATAIAAPLLVDAPMTNGTIAFLLLALAAAGVVIAVRGWPWLLQISIVGSLVQAGAWANNDRGEHHSALLVVAVLVAWWALQALPALFFEVRADGLRLRMPTSGALFQLAGLTVLFGRVAFDSVHSSGFAALLCVLAALHLLAGAVMLHIRPSSRAGAIFVWAIGAALAAGAAAVLLGGAAQPAFWAVEALAMLWLYVRFADKQAGVTAALLGALTAGWSLYLAQPAALAHPLRALATGVLAVAALTVMLGGAAVLLRRVAEAALAFAVASWIALFYGAGLLVVGLAAPATGPVDQAAQILVTLVWAGLATAGCVAVLALPPRLRAGARIVAESTVWVVAAKALAVDSLGLGMHEPRVLWLLAGLGALAGMLAFIERRLPPSVFFVPLATPLAAVLLVSGLTQPGLDAYRAGTPHLPSTVGVLGLGLAAALVALWRFGGRPRADALVVAVAFVVEALALTTVTLLTPRLGVTSENALRAVSVGPLVLGLALLGGALLVRRAPEELRERSLHTALGVLGLSAVLAVGNTAVFGATGGAIAVAAFWLAAAAALALSLRRRPGDLLFAATAAAVGMCVFALVTTAPPSAFAYGAAHGWWALAAAAIAAAAAAFAALCVPLAQRAMAVVVASAVALYGASALVVTALTPHPEHASQTAQLALSVAWTIWGLGLLGAGVFRAPRIGFALRAKGLAVSGVAALLAIGDTLIFGAGRGLIAVAAVWLAATVALSLAARRRPEAHPLFLAAGLAVGVCAFALVAIAPPDAIAYGAAHGWWALAVAAIAAAATVVAAICAPADRRTAAVAAALLVALYGVSVLVVTALAQDARHLDQFAQLALSVVWTVWGVAMLGAGVVQRTQLGLFLRRSGIALTGVAAAKVLIVDTSHFDTAHRAGVFLALGLILLAGAAAYARLTRSLDVSAV